jgi:hypothetical protein
LALAVVRDLRGQRAPVGPEELAEFETDVLAGFMLAWASAGLVDVTIAVMPGTWSRFCWSAVYFVIFAEFLERITTVGSYCAELKFF